MPRQLIMSLVILLFAFAFPDPGMPQSNQGVISGTVTRLDGTGGVPEVQVLLVGPATGTALNAIRSNPLMAAEIAEGASLHQEILITGKDGRFQFQNLDPGLYTIRAKREGYFGASMPGSLPTATLVTASVNVVAGQTQPAVSLALAKGVTVSGRVLRPDGRPMPNVTVGAFALTYNQGKPKLSAKCTKTTDDRGEYRLFWLPPGEFYIGAAPRQSSSADGQPLTYACTYYPTSTDPRTARRFLVKDGGDLSGIDIHVQPSGTTKITGRVVHNFPEAAVPQGWFSEFYLVSRDPASLMEPQKIMNATTGRGEQFELRGVPSGTYDLITSAFDSQGRRFTGRTLIDLGAQDIENIIISIAPGVEVRARVLFDGEPIAALPPTSGQQSLSLPSLGANVGPITFVSSPGLTARETEAPAIRLQLRSKESYPDPFDMAAATATIDSDGTVVFPNVPKSVYAVQVSGTVPANAYVADIREAGVSIYDTGIEVTDRPPGMIEVILNSNGATVKGKIRDADAQTLVNALVVLVPEQSRRRNPALYKNVRSDTDGTFTITAVPPGEYKLFAWRDVFCIPSTAYMNTEFMSKYEVRGENLTTAAGATVNVDLTVLPID